MNSKRKTITIVAIIIMLILIGISIAVLLKINKGLTVISFTETMGGEGCATLKWKERPGESDYLLYELKGGVKEPISNVEISIGDGEVTADVKGLPNGEHSLLVEAGVRHGECVVNTEVIAPDAAMLEAESSEERKVKLTWKTVPKATSYQIYRRNTNQEDWIQIKDQEAVGYTDESVEPFVVYVYKVKSVRSVNGVTAEADSKEITAMVEGTPRAVVVGFETISSKRMVTYLEDAGFDAELITSLDELDVSKYDTLVIPGGNNITPSVYGAERDPETFDTDLEEDHLQIDAVKKFVEAEKPVLGICRGCQIVNVAFGGTLEQHIPGWHKGYRDVKIDSNSWLYEELGESESVRHYHHQCADKIGEGLVVTQRDSEDGRVEGLEHETLPVYALQWHPDMMKEKGVRVFELYKDLVVNYMKEQGASV